MNLLQTDFGPKIVYLLGFSNLLGLALVFFSCRCLMGERLSRILAKIPGYGKFYRLHCYFWWFFFISVGLHVLLAYLVFGNPFRK